MIQLFPPPPPSGGILFAPPLSAAGRPRPCPSVGSLRSPALWYPKRTSRCSLARSFRPLRVLRLAASATGGARLPTPFPSPAAGEGPPIPITACSAYSLGSVTFCYWFAVVPNKIRRRHLESVSAALYGSTFQLPLKRPTARSRPRWRIGWGYNNDCLTAKSRPMGAALFISYSPGGGACFSMKKSGKKGF